MCFVEVKFVLAASGVTAGSLQVFRVWTGGGVGVGGGLMTFGCSLQYSCTRVQLRVQGWDGGEGWGLLVAQCNIDADFCS